MMCSYIWTQEAIDMMSLISIFLVKHNKEKKMAHKKKKEASELSKEILHALPEIRMEYKLYNFIITHFHKIYGSV